jgi:hypothetical protein
VLCTLGERRDGQQICKINWLIIFIESVTHTVCQRNDPTDNKNNTDDDAVSETPYTSDLRRGKFRNTVVRPADELLFEPFQADASQSQLITSLCFAANIRSLCLQVFLFV